MENVYYLPNELPTAVNYPEVAVRRSDIQALNAYAVTVQTAMNAFNTGGADKINVNEDELNTNIALCRDVCNTLGTAPNICFDVLTQLRGLQKIMQNLIYMKRQYGDQYIGTPNTTKTGSGL